MKPYRFPLMLAVVLAAGPAPADEAAPAEGDFVEVPPPPPPVAVEPDEETVDPELEPEVTIIRRRDATYEEYRVNGRLYMVKVTPVAGPPYYYVDRDGDGLLESRTIHRDSVDQVPQWVIFSW